jgi:4'-phosphopantetheinyl transferase
VWIVNLDRWAEHGLDAGTLDTGDYLQAEHLRDATARCRLLARRSVTRWILAEALDVHPSAVPIERVCSTCSATTHGRPGVSGVAIPFSVSSSGTFATVAVSNLPVGIDVEVARTDTAPLDFALSDNERGGIGDCVPDKRGVAFLRLWTAKEAVLKAAGGSVVDDLAGIDVSGLLAADQPSTVARGRRWNVRELTVDPHVDAVVALADPIGAEVVMKYISAPIADQTCRR